MTRPALAILVETLAQGRSWLHEAAGIVSFNPARQSGTMVLHNVERPFLIVSDPDRLRGVELLGFEIVGRWVPARLVEMARTRVRT